MKKRGSTRSCLLHRSVMLLMLGLPSLVFSQALSYTGGTLSENFDSMGPAGTNTPLGWLVGWSGPGSTSTTNVAVSNGSVAPNQVAGWNFGIDGAADRALGLMATSSGSPTPPGTNRFIEVRLQNLAQEPLRAINVHYDGEEWRTGSSSSQVNRNQLQFSTDGVTFVSMGTAFQFTQPVFTPVSTALDGNASASRKTNIGGIFFLPAPVNTGAVLYLRWLDINDPSTEPALAIDNFAFSLSTNAAPPDDTVVSLTNIWRYNESGVDLGLAWKETNYNDINWRSGQGVLAFENVAAVTALTNTVLALSNAAGQRIITYYFRTQFSYTNDPAAVYLVVSNLIDDGAIAYLNGRELYRFNMPQDPPAAATLASAGISGNEEGVFFTMAAPSSSLVNGTNTLAVEVHQSDPASSDVVFGLVLRAETRTNGPAAIIAPPADQVAEFGSNVAFTVLASGAPPLSYQWFFNGAPIGGTGDTLTLPVVSLIQDGYYSVRASNVLNAVTSPPARLSLRSDRVVPAYFSDFEAGAGPEWSARATSITPIGARRFLGEFSNETARLTLGNLPPHTNVTVAFDLLLMRSWDGTRGPDMWELNVDGTNQLVHTIFQVHNTFTTPPFPHQSFPDPFLGGSNAAFTGASEVHTLGYFYNSNPEDCVYRMSYSCSHSNSALQVNFIGLTDEPIANESWGIDNVSVTLSADAPEPWSRITTQPQSLSVSSGTIAIFNVAALGPAPFSYQWQRDGTKLVDDDRITGASSDKLAIGNVRPADAGSYTVIVSNGYGRLLSLPALLALQAPPFHWVRQAGGAGGQDESGDGVALDGSTHLYVSGNFGTAADFGSTNVTAPSSGMFLARYTAAGTLEWVRTATSASPGGEAHNVAVDPQGNCYLTGSFMDTTSFGVSNLVSSGGSDVFVAKYDRSGKLLWVVKQGGGFNDSGRGIAADGTNGCFVTGILQSSTDADTSRDAFFARYDATGALQWQRQPVGPATDAGMAAASDKSGNVYFTGWFTGTVSFGNTNLTTAGALRDIFAAKFNHTGALLWVAQVGEANADEGKGIGVDANGDVYVVGSVDLDFSGSNNARRLRVTKLSNGGAIIWMRDLDAPFYFFDFSGTSDLDGNTWVFAGLHGSGNVAGVPVSASGIYDGLVAKFNSSGGLVWVTQIGGTGSAIGHRIAADVSGNCYLTGEFDGVSAVGSSNIVARGGTDFFVARLDSDITPAGRLEMTLSNYAPVLHMMGTPGSLWTVEASERLDGADWTAVTNLILPSAEIPLARPSERIGDKRFYRARAE